jgi:hypothetical protein
MTPWDIKASLHPALLLSTLVACHPVIAGWLIQEEVRRHRASGTVVSSDAPPTRVPIDS